MEIEKGKQLDLKKYRAFLFPVVVIVLIALSAVTILKPKINDLSQLRKNLSKQKEELTQLSQKVAVLESYDQNELKKRADTVLRVLPAEKDAPRIIVILRGLVDKYNLELGSLNIKVGDVSTESAEPAVKDDSLPALQLQLSVTGSLTDFYELLNTLESAAPIFGINQISMSRSGFSVGTKTGLSSYYLAMPKEIGKISRQIIPITPEEENVYEKISGYKSVSTGTSLPFVGSGKENPFTF